MTTFSRRNGQWVLVPVELFTSAVIASHGLHVVDGYAVGLHFRTANADRAEVHLVNAQGETALIGTLPYAALRPLLDTQMVPAPRLATCRPDWVPEP